MNGGHAYSAYVSTETFAIAAATFTANSCGGAYWHAQLGALDKEHWLHEFAASMLVSPQGNASVNCTVGVDTLSALRTRCYALNATRTMLLSADISQAVERPFSRHGMHVECL